MMTQWGRTMTKTLERPDDEAVNGNRDGGVMEIRVAIDIHGMSRSSLEAMAFIAERVKASLVGMFTQDLLLLRVAELPFTTEVVRSTGEERHLYADSLRSRHELALSRVKGVLEECARSRQLSCRFEVHEQPALADGQGGQVSGVYLPGNRRRTTAQAQRLKIFYDGSAEGQRALDMAQTLVDAGLCRELLLVSVTSVPATVLGDLSSRDARVYLLNEVADQQRVLHRIVDGPAVDLVVVPRTLVVGIEDQLLRASLGSSVSGGTLLVF